MGPNDHVTVTMGGGWERHERKGLMKFAPSMTLIEVATTKLKPHPFSAEAFPDLPQEEYSALKNDIKEKGIRQPLEILPDFRIIDGHHRHKIALELGLITVPCVVHDLDDKSAHLAILTANLLRRQLTPEQRSTIRLKYMREVGINEQGRPGKGLNLMPLSEVSNILETPVPTLKRDLAYGRAIEKHPELKGQPITSAIIFAQRADKIAQLRTAALPIDPSIICGDALIEIGKLKDESVALLLTDPPYGVSYHSKNQNIEHSYNRAIPADDPKAMIALLDQALKKVKPKLLPDAHIYIFMSDSMILQVLGVVKKYFQVQHVLIWDKGHWTIGDIFNDYGYAHENIIFAKKGDRRMLWGKRQGDVFHYPGVPNHPLHRDHPTEKPVDLLKQLILNSTVEGELVLDCFAGSGSTLVAAKQLRRRYCGIEIDREWYECMVRRVAEAQEYFEQ